MMQQFSLTLNPSEVLPNESSILSQAAADNEQSRSGQTTQEGLVESTPKFCPLPFSNNGLHKPSRLHKRLWRKN